MTNRLACVARWIEEAVLLPFVTFIWVYDGGFELWLSRTRAIKAAAAMIERMGHPR